MTTDSTTTSYNSQPKFNGVPLRPEPFVDPKAFGINDYLATQGYQNRKLAPGASKNLAPGAAPAKKSHGLIDTTISTAADAAMSAVEELLTLDELEFLLWFVKDVGFYIENLEDNLGEALDDFWHSREHAHHILTETLLRMLSVGRPN